MQLKGLQLRLIFQSLPKPEIISSLTVSFECFAALVFPELAHFHISQGNVFCCLLQEMPLVS